MTSLSEQLRRLALPGANNGGELAKRPSLLFDPKTAATLDRDTFYALGVNGFEELCSIDKTLHDEFHNDFFSESAKNTERSVLSQEENSEMNEKLQSFLLRISPYFLMRPTQKCLEWLIYRFRIHCFNVDDIMRSFLPFHDTKLFVKLIQLLDISHPTNKWCWIAPIQKPGVALAKATISTHCMKDSAFFYFLCDGVVKAIQAHSALNDASGSLRPMINFYAAVTLGTIYNMTKISDQFLAQIVPFLVKGLKSKETDFKAATYMIICQISTKATLTEQVVTSLLKSLCKYNAGRLYQEFLTTVLIINQTQENIKSLPEICLQKLCSMTNFLEILEEYNTENEIERFLRLFLARLIPAAFHQPNPDIEISVAEDIDEDQSFGNYKKILLTIIQTFQVGSKLQEFIVRSLLEEFIKQEVESTIESAQLIQQVQRKYPESFDVVVANLSKTASLTNKESSAKQLNKFISISMDTAKHQVTLDGNVSLVLSFSHPEPTIRLSAIESVEEMLSTYPNMVESEFVKDSIKQRLLFDDSPEVVTGVLKLIQSHPTILSDDSKLTCKILIKLVYKTRGDLDWDDVYLAALTLLTSEQFAPCSDDMMNMIALIVYDVILGEICSTKESSAYNICVRDSYFENNSDALIPFKSSATMSSVITSTTKLFENDPKLLSDLWKAELNISMIIKTDDNSIEQRTASHFLFSHVIFDVFRRAEPSSIKPDLVNICTSILLHTLEDVSEIVNSRQNLEQSDEPQRKKAKTSFNHFESFQNCLSNMVTAICETKNDDDLALKKMNVLCSVLIEFFKIVQSKGSKAAEINNVYENYVVKLDAGVDKSGDLSKFCYNVRNDIFTHLLKFLTSGNSDSVLMKILRSLVQNFFSFGFSNLQSVIYFLASYWNPQLGNTATEISSVQSLYIGQAILLANTAGKLALDPIIPSLIAALSNPLSAIRKAALACLYACTKYKNEGKFQELISFLAEHKDELESDSFSIVELLAVFFAPSSSKKKIDHDHQIILDILLKQYICCENVPVKVRVVLLLGLRKVNSSYICSALLSSVDKLLNLCDDILKTENKMETTTDIVIPKQISVDEATFLYESILKVNAEFLTNEHIKSMFMRAISCNLKLQSKMSFRISPQSVSLGMINKVYFSALSHELKQELICHILNTGTKSQDPSTITTITKFFKVISLDATHVVEELTKVLQLRKIMPVTSSVKAKRTRLQKTEPDFTVNINEILPTSEGRKRTTLLLELIQYKKKIFNPQSLFPALFEVLEFVLDISSDQTEDFVSEGFEYIKQLLLTTMLRHFQKLKTHLMVENESKVLMSSHCKVELLVHCVRTSENAQTQQHALLLLSEIATVFPDKVLHNVMSIFTFMGSHMLRQDDAYSFQVISTTIKTIIPTLMKNKYEKNNNVRSNEDTVLKVLRVFVDSLPHIPSHRRITVFQEVLNTVGHEEYLWMILVLLVDQYSCKPTAGDLPDHSIEMTAGDSEISEENSPLTIAMEIWTSIFQLSSSKIQVESLILCLEYMMTIPNQSATNSSRPVKPCHTILDIRLHSTNQLRRFKLVLLAFFSHLLEKNHAKFVDCLVITEQENDDMMMESREISKSTEIMISFQKLFEKLLDVIHQTELSNKQPSDPRTVKYYKVLIHKTYEVTHQINFLLPLSTFLLIVDGLLKSKLISTQRKALELLAERITSAAGNLELDEVSIVLDISKELMQLATSSVQGSTEKHDDHSLLRYSSLITLKLIIRSCAKSNPNHFINIFPLLANIISNNKNEDNQILSATFLCLAELCSTLKAYCIPHMNCFVPGLIQLMCTTRALQNEMILFSCITALHRLLEHLPNFISPYLDNILAKVTSLLLLNKYCLNEEHQSESGSNMTTQIATRLKVVTNILATKVPSRVLIPAINKCREKVEGKRPLSIKPLCNIIHKHVASLDKDGIRQNNQTLVSLFIELLDIRLKNFEGVSDIEVDDIEDNACEALIAMMLKLSENLFRPLFFKLYDWACLSENPPDRLLTYYKLMYKLSAKMKGLFSIFAGHLINHIAEILKETLRYDETEIFPRDIDKKKNLLKFVCETLYNTLLYDTSGFLSRDRFELLLHPLVNQLENVAGDSDELDDDLMNEHVIPCLGQVAASVTDDVCWKPFNYQILLKTRHASPKVRYASLNAIQAVAEKLGEDYTILLPESVPFFAELMEDEEEKVEKKCHEVIRKLEKILGEPLQKYF